MTTCCVYIADPLTSFCVESSHSAVGRLPLLPSPAVFLSLTHWVPLTLKYFVVPLLPFPSLRFSYSPVTLISMCPEQYEWVSTPPATPRLQTGMPLNDTSFTPPLSSLTSPRKSSLQLKNDHPACRMPACLPDPLAEHATKKKKKTSLSPAVFSPSPSSPL